ncbi:hypothetical protein ACJMK2_035353 [Sinanodonta woodiana]|uniref:Dehydrogenase/reductase SDR family protein 7-like n=1 Tax=Sinanodonta woodiana TaxID=1069815 RepID=A0ABD3WUP1_SINWO
MDMGFEVMGSIIGTSLGLLYLIHILSLRKKRIELKGKVVLITGTTSGLGKACAFAFYEAGCHLILAGRNRASLEQLQAQLQSIQSSKVKGQRAEILELDLEDVNIITAKAEAAVQLFGKVDVLVNNAGVSYRGQIEDTLLDVDMKVMLVNYFGHVALTKAFLAHMIGSGGGSIVGISSVQGRVAIPFRSSYAASKHAFQAFFDSLRAEIHDRNVHVCVVSPGYIQTNLSQNAICGDGSKYGTTDSTTASGMTPEEVARHIVLAVIWNQSEVICAPVLHRLLIYLRPLFPNLYFWIMNKRARKQKKDYTKRS